MENISKDHFYNEPMRASLVDVVAFALWMNPEGSNILLRIIGREPLFRTISKFVRLLLCN